MGIYLDNAATRPLSDGMKEYLSGMLDEYGNPSSQYSVGRKARDMVEDVRRSVAKFVGLPKNGRVIFTSGGSASNSLAVSGYEKYEVAYSSTMHESMLEAMRTPEVSYEIPCDREGFLNLDVLEYVLKHEPHIQLVCVEQANSECGVIQDIKAVADIAHRYMKHVYVDCTGSVATLPINMQEVGVDAVGFSAHKIGGLKGCGVFCMSNGTQMSESAYYPEPIVYGEQNYHMFGGTENTLGIASLGYAVDHIEYKAEKEEQDIQRVYDNLVRSIPEVYVVGPALDSGRRLPNNLYVCIRGVYGEALVELLDQAGIQVSTGSACSTGHESPVLAALDIPKEDRHSCIRLTLCGGETQDELDYAVHKIVESVCLLRESR